MPPHGGDLLFCGVVLPLFFHAFSPLSLTAERSLLTVVCLDCLERYALIVHAGYRVDHRLVIRADYDVVG
jgi:hypothetical protein